MATIQSLVLTLRPALVVSLACVCDALSPGGEPIGGEAGCWALGCLAAQSVPVQLADPAVTVTVSPAALSGA